MFVITFPKCLIHRDVRDNAFNAYASRCSDFFEFLNVDVTIIFDNALNTHAPDCFDSDLWTVFIVVLINLVCVGVSTHRS